MISEKRLALQPLFESSDGIHLTAYLAYESGSNGMKVQLRETISLALKHLQPVMSRDTLKRFLKPIQDLLMERNLLKGFRGNIGIFRSHDSFRLLKIPVAVEPLCVVASSFHIKPLLRWMQVDRDFLLLHLEPEVAQLYQGSQFNFQCMETVIFAKVLSNGRELDKSSVLARAQGRRMQLGDSIDWLTTWLLNYTKRTNPRLFITGEKAMTEALMRRLHSYHVAKPAVLLPFDHCNVSAICTDIRSILKKDARKAMEQAFIEFRCAEEMNLTNRNIFQIAKAATEGRVRKLIVADGIQIWGKLDCKTGDLSIHPAHMDHQDDDILDDLAQTVLAQGGEVIVAARDQIPRGRPALAILYDRSSDSSIPAKLMRVESYRELRATI